MSHTVAKNRTHDVADLDFGAPSQWFSFFVADIWRPSTQLIIRWPDEKERAIRNPPLSSVPVRPYVRQRNPRATNNSF